ncbi:MAG: hypothetical protein AAGC77_04860 [Pseudomonadota bacterium]
MSQTSDPVVSPERLSAFLDGELSELEAAEIKSRLNAEPQLREALERQRDLKNAIAAAYDDVLDQPVPQHLIDTVMETEKEAVSEKVVAFRPRTFLRFAQPMAIAASLAIGLVVGALLSANNGAFTEFRNGQAVIASAHTGAFQSTTSGAAISSRAGEVRFVETFVSKDEQLCREFELSANDDLSAGLACLHAQEWRLVALAPRTAPRAPSGAYTPAAGSSDDAISAISGEIKEGAALSLKEEAAVIARNWR